MLDINFIQFLVYLHYYACISDLILSEWMNEWLSEWLYVMQFHARRDQYMYVYNFFVLDHLWRFYQVQIIVIWHIFFGGLIANVWKCFISYTDSFCLSIYLSFCLCVSLSSRPCVWLSIFFLDCQSLICTIKNPTSKERKKVENNLSTWHKNLCCKSPFVMPPQSCYLPWWWWWWWRWSWMPWMSTNTNCVSCIKHMSTFNTRLL